MKPFDKYMLHVDVGTDEKFAHLSEVERLAHVVGVLAVAAKSPVRGVLLVGDMPATAAHVARRAGVSERVAASAIRKLREVGVLVHDEELGALRVLHWDRYNPAPKRDATAAERQRRRRERVARERDVTPASRRDGRDGLAVVTPLVPPAVTPAVTNPEGEREQEGEGTTSRPAARPAPPRPEVAALSRRLATLIAARDDRARVSPESPRWLAAIRLLLDEDGRSPAEVEAVIVWLGRGETDDARFWQSNVLSAPKLREKFTQLVAVMQRSGSAGGQERPMTDLERRTAERAARLAALDARERGA